MDAGRAHILQADAGRLPLPAASVDLVVTSPPYLWKRKYAIEGTGELGNERDWRQYLDNLWSVTDEMLRVLKPSGSIFVNLGDARVAGREPKWLGVPPKSKLLLPERYRVGCQDRYADQGVIVRQVQVWDKPNGLPESATDRTRDSHEDFVHLTKRPNYYSAIDEVRESYSPEASQRRTLYGQNAGKDGLAGLRATGAAQHGSNGVTVMGVGGGAENPLGKLPGSVWSIPSEPLRLPAHLGVDHYAAFPSEWPRRLILGFSPPGICLECGQGRVPVVERDRIATQATNDDRPEDWSMAATWAAGRNGRSRSEARILGYACPCVGERQVSTLLSEANEPAAPPPPTRPSVVLDPFSGTGTTVMVARALGRIGLSFDLSMPYARAARWRIHHDAGKAISRTNLERQGSLL